MKKLIFLLSLLFIFSCTTEDVNTGGLNIPEPWHGEFRGFNTSKEASISKTQLTIIGHLTISSAIKEEYNGNNLYEAENERFKLILTRTSTMIGVSIYDRGRLIHNNPYIRK